MSWFRDPVGGFGDFAGFIPGLLIAIVLALLLCGRVASRLRIGRVAAALLVVSVGIVLAATVTPSRAALAGGSQLLPGCDLSRWGPATWPEYLYVGDTSLNVALCVPLGVLIGMLPRSPYRAPILVAAVMLPIVIEGFQMVAVPLGRACQSADVFDNLLGLVIGLAVGSVLGWIGRRVR